ncbi:MAG: tagaturonate reductase [Spirochaetales bacterium]|uniref:Tagaturonate reductase n=1 Tax=Candidatus Thalassospirochaeta sargassi TaxID=3119039 RepID=A0AAJ1I9H2_9SPIO|nr:tagaturonate reductase [Spirochaetales bacterium]
MIKTISEYKRQYDFPIRIVQFGEGNFLRAFWGKAINDLNRMNVLNSQICVIQPIEHGKLSKLAEQNYLYNVCLQSEDVENIEIIESIKTGINPYIDFNGFTALAGNPDLRFIISNTTEAGIVLDPEDSIENTPPQSFPGKLLYFLYTRYKMFKGQKGKGLLIFPSELIENNGTKLLEIMLSLSERLSLDPDFKRWLTTENEFFNTLVDGIVTGYPFAEAEKFENLLGYKDNFLVKGEPYQLLVIQGNDQYRSEFPIEKAALNVVWTDDLDFYRKIKVRMMNGIQTVMSLSGFLSGLKTEREALNNPIIGAFMKMGLYDEISPTLSYSELEKNKFADKMLERLNNPFIEHFLEDINLNSFSKYQSRIQPSLSFWQDASRPLPFLLFSTAVLLSFYMNTKKENGFYYGECCGIRYQVYDTLKILETFAQLKVKAVKDRLTTQDHVESIFKEKELWLETPKLSFEQMRIIINIIESIEEKGIIETITDLRKGGLL